MTLKLNLQQKQTQSLVMTQALAQSIKLLQLGHAELLAFVKEEVEKNPLLELASDTVEQQNDAAQLPGLIDQPQPGEVELRDDRMPEGDDNPDAGEEMVSGYDIGSESAQTQHPQSSHHELPGQSAGAAEIEDFDLFENLQAAPSLTVHLERQIVLQFRKREEYQVAMAIAHGLDEDGYFREDLKAFARRTNTGLDLVHWVLEKFQCFEPVGIGARNLAECLELQLKEKNRFDPAMQTLLENIDLLARREFAKLTRACGVSKEDFSEMLKEIRTLDPRPARSYEPVLAEVVVPDILISRAHHGGWNIELNAETLPKVLVNHDYHVQLSEALDDVKDHKFVTECMDNANWLVKSLDQRAHTMLKVATEIVRKQDRFFAEGTRYLKPLKLKDVADAIKMHESTVSRVTSNKYLNCERGTFELKYFFSSSVSSSDGGAEISAESVKYQIQKLVDAERPEKILSDGQIAEQLQAVGISIARRTVAKYREALNISSSAQRRRQKSGRL